MKIGKILAGTINRLEKRKDGITTGLHALDRLTYGFNLGDLVAIASTPEMGSTSMLVSMVANYGYQPSSALKCTYLSPLSSQDEFGFRSLAALSRIDHGRLRTGKLHDRDWPKLAEGAHNLAKSGLQAASIPCNITLKELTGMILAEKPEILMIDGFDYLSISISELKSFCLENAIMAFITCEVDRKVFNRPNKRPMLTDLRNPDVHKVADFVLFLYRDEVVNPNTDDRGILECIIAKNNRGEKATVRLAFLPEYGLLANLATDMEVTRVDQIQRPTTLEQSLDPGRLRPVSDSGEQNTIRGVPDPAEGVRA
jgi:replicative DNA helicase